MRFNGLQFSNQSRRAERASAKRAPWSLRIVTMAATIVLILTTANAWAGIAIDAAISTNGSRSASSITTPSFSTQSGNELLLAFVATDYISGNNTTVTSVSGAGVTWTLVKRTNAQKGTAEIWRAFATTPLSNVTVTAALSQSVLASITVVTYAGVDTSGTNGSGAIGATAGVSASKGAPSASLVTTRNGSWVFGVGNDYDNAIARKPDSGQSLMSQYLTSSGDTYWVQEQNAPTLLAGTTVKIDDTAPTADRFNLTIAEVLPLVGTTSFTISGTITPSSLGSGSQVALSQSGTTLATVTADGSGNFAFTNVPNGAYTVTPSKSGVSFSPLSTNVTVSGANVTGTNFSATSQTWGLSGNVSPALSGVNVALTGQSNGNTTTDSLGNYSFTGLTNGTYGITPSLSGYTFTPASQNVTVNGANVTGINFAGSSVPTWNISGTITPAAVGVTVNLSGAASATITTDANGNYSFTGLANGSYTVSPSETGYTFTPTNQAVTLNGASQSGVNFTAQHTASWSISGTIGSGCSGCAYVQSTHSSQSGHTDWPTLLNVKAGDALVYIGEFTNWTPGSTVNMTDSHGNTWYRCDNNATSDFVEIQDGTGNGMSCQYTLNIAAWPTITAQPVASQCVNTSCTQVGGSFFELALPATATARAWATPFAGTSTSGTNNVNCGLITLPEANDFLMCDFNNASGTPMAGTTPVAFTMRETVVTAIETGLYSGSGTINPTGTINTSGISYTSITVAFGAAGNGAGATVSLSGTSSATTTADTNGNYSFTGLTNGSYVVTPSEAGLSFAPTSQSVTVNGANQTGVNFTVQSVASYGISGTISGGAGAAVTLSGSISTSTVADGNGNYAVTGLANGSYTVTPTKGGYTFSPAAQTVSVNGANVPGVNFTATAQTWTVSGTITPATADITVTLTGSSGGSTTTDGSGNYSFTGLTNGAYVVTPSLTGYTFTPASQNVTVNGANVTGINFAGSSVPTWSISGSITPAAAGIAVNLSGTSNGTTVTDSSGNYTFGGLANGTYVLTPSQSGYSFAPPALNVTVNGANVTGQNFTRQQTVNGVLAIDANISHDNAAASKAIGTPSFSTSAANELLLAFVATDYISGSNTTVNSITGGSLTWTLVQRTNVQSGTAEIWRAFSTTPLSNATVTASLSQSVGASITVVSFTGVDSTGSNGSGAIGAVASGNASTGAPAVSLVTTRNGSWVFGVGNDFDNAIARTPATGQSLVHQYLTPFGDTYWMQMQSATTPNSGTVVSISDTAPTGDRFNLSAVEVLPSLGGNPPPPTVNLIAPASGTTVALTTTVAANATDAGYGIQGVQFLVDGNNIGTEITVPPYAVAWDTTTVPPGQHTLTAIAYNNAQVSTVSSPAVVTVDNSGNPAIIGSWSSVYSLPTVAVNLVLLHNNTVLFYEDGSTPTVWDYTNGNFNSITTNENLFCSGHASLGDGRVLMVGGYGGDSSHIGVANAEIFDPGNNTFTPVPPMTYRRWYPTATTLGDGRVLVTAGWQTTAHSNAGIPEIYDPNANSWTKLTGANNPFETYPFMYLLPNGNVIHVGGTEYPTVTESLNIVSQTWTTVDSRVIDGGSSTMYLPNKFVKAGSATDSQGTGPSSNTTFVLDLTQNVPLWQQTPPMTFPRSFLNLTELPDGTVLATGGETDKNGGNIANAVYAAELWNPQTTGWSTMASMHTPREYHSTALLLPDGRVLQSGMGADFGQVPNETSAEFFSPPYLFKGARPTITVAPGQVHYGQNFTVTTPNGPSIASVVLIRAGAATHFFDQATRFVPLSLQQTNGGLSVTSPSDGNAAPPGYYMLFIVNNNGVPSVAPIVQVGP
jgi:hypothetical protein